MMRFHLFDHCNIPTIKRKSLKWKFQSDNRLTLAGKQTQYKENIQN